MVFSERPLNSWSLPVVLAQHRDCDPYWEPCQAPADKTPSLKMEEVVRYVMITLPKTNMDTQNDALEKVTTFQYGNVWYLC